jgi:hypothetical protein
MPATGTELREDSMAAPEDWVGRNVSIELRDCVAPERGVSGGTTFARRSGILQEVSDYGVRLGHNMFVPWSSIRQMTLRG